MQSLEDQTAQAEAAVSRGDWVAALRLWQSLNENHPERLEGLLGSGTALRELGRLDEADAVFADANARFQESPWPLINHGWIAARRGDWDQALHRWQIVRDRFPAIPEGYVGIGEALARLGRTPEADDILETTIERFPTALWPSVYYALLAAERCDWPTALRRWEITVRRFPAALDGHVGIAEAYAALRCVDKVDRSLLAAENALGVSAQTATRLAETAMRLQRFEVAARLWATVRERFADELSGYLRGAEALRQTGRAADAERTLEQAIQRFASSQSPRLAAIRLALDAGDRPEALRRWRELVRLHPSPDPSSLNERLSLRKELVLTATTIANAELNIKHWVPGSVISEDPVIILTDASFFEVAEATAPFYKGRTVYFFVGMLWTISADSEWRQQYKDRYTRLAAHHPNLKITVLANDMAELDAVHELGIPVALVNQHAFLDDTLYDIRPVGQTYKAVYNARFAEYKRHHLARNVPDLKLIVVQADNNDARELQKLLPDCTIANRDGGTVRNLTNDEVAYHLNTARCGLCLSAREGAMFASAEYLLCGLPVVTTQNAGGRNWLFSQDHTIFCDDDPGSVADAVEEIIHRDISRQWIRETVRQRIRRERLVFFDLVDQVFSSLGQGQRRFEPEFNALFCDKLNYFGRQVEDFLVP